MEDEVRKIGLLLFLMGQDEMHLWKQGNVFSKEGKYSCKVGNKNRGVLSKVQRV